MNPASNSGLPLGGEGGTAPTSACASCGVYRAARLRKLGVNVDQWDHVVALAGNPNTGKSTVFNALTGLRQHTGNWPGKTVVRAEGGFDYAGKRYKLVDLPGTYSLLSTSVDEQVARDFILFGQPDVTVVVVDATRLERNLNLTLQVLEITSRAVVCVNLMDEARRAGLDVDDRQLARDLGVPVVLTTARRGEGLPALLEAIAGVASGVIAGQPHRLTAEPAAVRPAIRELVARLEEVFPGLPNLRWVALRLLGGDEHLIEAVRRGEVADLQAAAPPTKSGAEARALQSGEVADLPTATPPAVGNPARQAAAGPTVAA